MPDFREFQTASRFLTGFSLFSLFLFTLPFRRADSSWLISAPQFDKKKRILVLGSNLPASFEKSRGSAERWRSPFAAICRGQLHRVPCVAGSMAEGVSQDGVSEFSTAGPSGRCAYEHGARYACATAVNKIQPTAAGVLPWHTQWTTVEA